MESLSLWSLCDIEHEWMKKNNNSVTISINNYRFQKIKSKQSLLEIMEDENIIVDYQCRNGYCGTCRMNLFQGNVVYFREPIACIPASSILPCCCWVEEDVILESCRAIVTADIE